MAMLSNGLQKQKQKACVANARQQWLAPGEGAALVKLKSLPGQERDLGRGGTRDLPYAGKTQAVASANNGTLTLSSL